MRLLVILVGLLITASLAACGSGDGGDGANNDPTATATAEAFDPRIYSQFVLRPEDVPPGLVVDDAFAPEAKSYTTVYRDPATQQQLIQSTVARVADRTQREALFVRFRRIYAGFFTDGEENYDLPNVDQAFLYRLSQPPAMSANILRGEFIIYVQINAYPGPPLKEDLDRYADLVVSRVNGYIDDPSSVPIPTANPFRPAEPSAEATPAPAATP